MKRLKIWNILTVFSLFLTACGGGGGSDPAPAAPTVSGVAAVGAPIAGQVWLKDRAGTEIGPVTTGAGGTYSFDVTGLEPPFFLEVIGTANGNSTRLRGVGFAQGIVNINPFSEIAIFAATGKSPEQVFADPTLEDLLALEQAILSALESIQQMLATLLTETGVTFGNPCRDSFVANGTGIDGVLDMIQIEIDSALGRVQIREMAMNQVVAWADIAAGETGMQNMVAMESAAAQDLVRRFGPQGTPTAAAGINQSVTTGSTVLLNGAASSDPNGDQLVFAWVLVQKPQGSQAQLSNSIAINPTFVADAAGQYIIALVVSDGLNESAEDLVVITVTDNNAPPVANAGGNRSVATGTSVLLDGNYSSDADNDQLTYLWTLATKPVGSSATLTNSTTSTPTLIPDVDGVYEVSLTVSDGTTTSPAATVIITASTSTYSVDPGDSALALAMVEGQYFIDSFLADDSLPGVYKFDAQTGSFENFGMQSADSPFRYRGDWDVTNGYTTMDYNQAVNPSTNDWVNMGVYGVLWIGSLLNETENALNLNMVTGGGSIQKPFLKTEAITEDDFRGKTLSAGTDEYSFDAAGNAGVYNGTEFFTWQINQSKELYINFVSGADSYFYFTATKFNPPESCEAAYVIRAVGVEDGSFTIWQLQ